jgi:inhibitor of KinA
LLCRHTNTNEVNRLVRIPVCYEPFFAPDIEALANQKSITLHQLITLHTSVTYKVFMIGFLPGFPYMGEVDSSLEASRHLQPRKAVAAGSVGIAGKQTGIYPLTSPGGWQIIGRTPLRLFDVNRENAVLLQPGDSVQFYSITANEFAHNQSRSA